MTIIRSTNRWVYRLLSLALLLGGGVQASVAGEVPLRAYTAVFDVTVGSRNLGTSELRLRQQGDQWQFGSVSKARGIYALLTSSQPSITTRFRADPDGLWLHDIRIGDANDEEAEETARFDWNNQRLEVDRKGRRRSLKLNVGVYDLLTIHLAAADLSLSERTRSRFKFYRKGRLLDSRLAYRGERRLSIGARQVMTQVYEQTFTGRSTRLRYFYEASNPLLPLRIERNDDDELTVMSLIDVDWDL